MNVCVQIQFKAPTEEDWENVRLLAQRLTNDRSSVRVYAGKKPEWLVAEFTMPTEAQYKAVEKVDSAIRHYASNRYDSIIAFPPTEAERARAKRKAERRKAQRKKT